MTKVIRIITVFVGLLLCLTQGQEQLLKGYTGWQTYSDSRSCFLGVNGDLGPTSATDPTTKFTLHQKFLLPPQQIPQAAPEGCFYHTYFHDSFFYDEPASGNMIFLIYESDSNGDFVLDTPLLTSDLQKANGSTCVSLPQSAQPELQQYVCKTMFGFTPVDFAVWGTGNFTFQNPTSSNALVFIEDVLNSREMSPISNIVTVNSSFPTIFGALYDVCGSTNTTTILSLSIGVTVTTTVDLTANIGGMRLAWTLVKQNGTKDYLSIPAQSGNPLFAPGTGNNSCWSMGVNYGDILPNLDYCVKGCKVSFVLTDSNSRLYTLKTYGLWTRNSIVSDPGSNSGSGTGSGSTNGNETGSGNSTGTGSGSGNGSGNGNNNAGAASSAVCLSFNALVVLIASAYLVWI